MLHCLVPAHTLLQAGIVAQGGLLPLLDLLETCQSNLQVRGGRGMRSTRGCRLCLYGPHAARAAVPTSPFPMPVSSPFPLQHNAAFALYGLSDNEDNLLEFVREGAVQVRRHGCRAREPWGAWKWHEMQVRAPNCAGTQLLVMC